MTEFAISVLINWQYTLFITNISQFNFFIQSGVINGPEIRKLMRSMAFRDTLSWPELDAWEAIKTVIFKVLGGNRAPENQMREHVKNMMDAFRKIGSSMTYKMHLISHHLDDFIKQSSKDSDEHGEHFHQTTMPMENRFKGKKLNAMLGEVCWWSRTVQMYEADDEEDSSDDENLFDNEDGQDGNSSYGDESVESGGEHELEAGPSTSQQPMEID